MANGVIYGEIHYSEGQNHYLGQIWNFLPHGPGI